ncbi:MAG TPA: RNA 3'-terminal phosphate cyclase [Conexivisphaerales archaeon]|nr:RNA 3'-terminal phosphate cyclase [Conexivisphaerales archaeon]
MLRIDGGEGEGGGQILRTSLLFSFVLGQGIEVFNIRAKRDNPGLRPQHLAVVTAFASATGGVVENAKVGSDVIRFSPGSEVPDRIEIDVGTAGSVTLILQTLLSAVSLKGLGTRAVVRGGTDTRWSPTYDYLEKVFEPAAALLGLPLGTNVRQRGYYPAGGGLVEGQCQPAKETAYVRLDSKPSDAAVDVFSVCGSLPESVAQRQSDSAIARLRGSGAFAERAFVQRVDSDSPGTSILVCHVEDGRVFLGSDAVGERGVRAEVVGASAASGMASPLSKGAAVDRHLADMLVPLMALQGGGEMVTDEETQHLRTNLAVAARFTGCGYGITREGGLCRVRVAGRTKA